MYVMAVIMPCPAACLSSRVHEHVLLLSCVDEGNKTERTNIPLREENRVSFKFPLSFGKKEKTRKGSVGRGKTRYQHLPRTMVGKKGTKDHAINETMSCLMAEAGRYFQP